VLVNPPAVAIGGHRFFPQKYDPPDSAAFCWHLWAIVGVCGRILAFFTTASVWMPVVSGHITPLCCTKESAESPQIVWLSWTTRCFCVRNAAAVTKLPAVTVVGCWKPGIGADSTAERCPGVIGCVKGTGVLRCAQEDGKKHTDIQRQGQTTTGTEADPLRG
jgi:hypothetical protein